MRLTFLALASVSLSACVTYQPTSSVIVAEPYFDLIVDSIADKSAKELKTFVVKPGIAGAKENDLRVIEMRKFVENALIERDYALISDVKAADFVVLFNYGTVDKKQETLTVGRHVVTGRSISFGGEQSFDLTRNGAKTTGTASSAPSYTNSFQVREDSSEISTNTTYYQQVVLVAVSARDYRSNKKDPREFWETVVTSESPNQNWRVIFPQMLAGAIDYIAGDTKGQHSFGVKFQDEHYRRTISSILEH